MSKKITLIFGSDHAGYKLKSHLKNYFEITNKYNIIDVGCYTDKIKVDYPNYAALVAEKIIQIPNSYGVLTCGTGIGMSIAANKIQYMRCALCTNIQSAIMAKRHNNANIIAMGERTTNRQEAIKMVQELINQDFEAGRHKRRIEMFKELHKFFK